MFSTTYEKVHDPIFAPIEFDADVDKLRSILKMQRDEYLPLKVIKERLLKQDAGDEDESPTLEQATAGDGGGATPSAAEEIAGAPTGLQMSLEELSAATGIDRDRIKELEGFGIVSSHGPE